MSKHSNPVHAGVQCLHQDTLAILLLLANTKAPVLDIEASLLTVHMLTIMIPFLQEELLQAVEGAGFEAKLLGSGDSSTLRIRIAGMTCSSCSSAIEGALNAKLGVVKASVSLITNTAEVLLFTPGTIVLQVRGPWSMISTLKASP